MTIQIESYAQGRWHAPSGELRTIHNATTEEPIAVLGSDELDFQGVLDHARTVGGPALRAMTFTERSSSLAASSRVSSIDLRGMIRVACNRTTSAASTPA